jgi:hypothetical protein
MKASGIKYLNSDKKKKQALKFLFENDHFISQIEKIRTKFLIETSDFNELSKLIDYCDRCNNINDHWTHLLESAEFNNEISLLMKEFKIRESYEKIICDYVICNDFPLDKDQNTGDIFLETQTWGGDDRFTGEPKFLIHIYQDTTLRDIKNAWATIKKITGKKTIRKSIYFNRNKLISELHKSGKKSKEIDILLKENGFSPLDYDTRKSIANKFKNKTKDPFSRIKK